MGIWSGLSSLTSPTLKQWLAHFRCSINICWRSECWECCSRSTCFTSNVYLDLFLCLWISSLTLLLLTAYSFLLGSISSSPKHVLRNSSREHVLAENYFNPCLSENTFVFPWLLNNVYIDTDFLDISYFSLSTLKWNPSVVHILLLLRRIVLST